MIAEARVYLVGVDSAPWLLVFPSLAVVMAVMGFLVLGDALTVTRQTERGESSGV